MLKKLILLINLIYTPIVLANSTTEMSGFAYRTNFGDDKWQQSKSVIAINVDHMHELFNVRAQISSYENSPIRRLTIGKTFRLFDVEKSHTTIQVGRVSRINSFFDNVIDTPATTNMAILPMAGYSYRMFQGAFVLVDGFKIDQTIIIDNHMFTMHYTYGDMFIPNQKEFKLEVLKKDISGITLESQIGNTVELHHEYDCWHTYISKSKYSSSTTLQDSNATAKYYYNNANITKYDLDKVGIMFDNDNYFGMIEYTVGYSAAYSINDVRTAKSDAWDQSTVIGVYLNDGLFLYTGESIGRNLTAKRDAVERFTGVTKKNNNATLSIAYHEGSGQGWMRYEALGPYEWKSLVTSLTVQF